MVDRDRVLIKIDELDGYLGELRSIAPASYDDFLQTEKRRACERLLQVSIECLVDVCGLLLRGKRLGLPADETDVFEKLEQAGVIPSSMRDTLRRMKGFRNILVHDYARLDDRITFDMVCSRMEDFERIKHQLLKNL